MHDWRREIERRLGGSRLDPATESEVVEELAQHLEERYAALVAQGVAATAAERQVLAELDVEAGTLAEAVRRTRVSQDPLPEESTSPGLLQGVVGDVRFAVRALRRTPGYTTVVLLTLALGIGAAVAAQAVVDPLLLRPLRFAQPDRLVTLETGMLPGEYLLVREHVNGLEASSLAYAGRAFGISGEGEAERVIGAWATRDLFRTLGVAPLLGSDPAGAAEDVAVLSYDTWQARFAGATDVIGRTIRINGTPVPVGAVMPRGFSYPGRTQVWLATTLDPADPAALWGLGGYTLVARLRDGATRQAVESQVRALSPEMSEANPFWTPAADYRAQVGVISLHEALVGDVRRALLLLGAAVALLLLIACANVANLVLARGLGRVREIAVRTALGASGGRIVRQLLTETLVLAAAGGAAGVLLAYAAVHALRGLLPADLPRLEEVGVDVRVLAASVVLMLLTGLLLGVLPARRARSSDVQSMLRAGGRSMVDRSGRRMSAGLAVAQVALAVLLVTGAGLLGRSLLALQRTDTGIGRLDAVTARIDLPAAHYGTAADRRAFYDELLRRGSALPGMQVFAMTGQLPFSGHLTLTAMLVDGVTEDPNNLPVFMHRRVTPDVFDALGIRLLRGRLLTEADGAAGALPVAVVDATTAAEMWPGEDPIGRRLGRPWLNEQLTVVGVVGAVLDGDLAGSPERTVYAPLPADPPQTAFIVVHAASGTGILPALRTLLRDLDASVPLSDVGTLGMLVSGGLAAQRFSATLLAAFGALALVLAVVGIYGVLAYAVNQRARELSLRLALGAQAGDVLRMVLREGMRLAGTGAALGIVGALALSRLLRGMLYGVEPNDPVTLTGVTLVVLAAAAAAVLVPAVRASRLDPMHALRE